MSSRSELSSSLLKFFEPLLLTDLEAWALGARGAAEVEVEILLLLVVVVVVLPTASFSVVVLTPDAISNALTPALLLKLDEALLTVLVLLLVLMPVTVA